LSSLSVERITAQAFRPAPTEDINARVQRAVEEYLREIGMQ